MLKVLCEELARVDYFQYKDFWVHKKIDLQTIDMQTYVIEHLFLPS